jgi:hypothetical protein
MEFTLKFKHHDVSISNDNDDCERIWINSTAEFVSVHS